MAYNNLPPDSRDRNPGETPDPERVPFPAKLQSVLRQTLAQVKPHLSPGEDITVIADVELGRENSDDQLYAVKLLRAKANGECEIEGESLVSDNVLLKIERMEVVLAGKMPDEIYATKLTLQMKASWMDPTHN